MLKTLTQEPAKFARSFRIVFTGEPAVKWVWRLP